MGRTLALFASTFLFPFWLLAQSATTTIELPIQFAEGYDPFTPGFGGIGPERPAADNSWFTTYLPTKGVPSSWTDTQKGMIWLDAQQFVYQNLMAGKLSQAFYRELQLSWSWIPDTTRLSAKPIRSFVYTVTGKNQFGTQVVLVDTNHNLDFSDEQVIVPPGRGVIWGGEAGKKHIVTLAMDYYERGRVATRQVTIAIGRTGKDISYNYPGHASASLLPIKGKGILVLAPIAF